MFKEFFYTVTVDKDSLCGFKSLLLKHMIYYKTMNKTVNGVTMNILVKNLREFYIVTKWLDKNNF